MCTMSLCVRACVFLGYLEMPLSRCRQNKRYGILEIGKKTLTLPPKARNKFHELQDAVFIHWLRSVVVMTAEIIGNHRPAQQ